MKKKKKKQICRNWRAYALASSVALISLTLLAAATRAWILTAAPIGFLFGFFLQKGKLCPANALKESIVSGRHAKTLGFLLCVVVSMCGFAFLEAKGAVSCNPKPALWAACLVGGALFGLGAAWAGGGIGGCLYRAGTGHLPSMAALLGVPLGMAIAQTGPLQPVREYLQSFCLTTANGSVPSIPTIAGKPFSVLACFFAIWAGVAIFWIWTHREGKPRKPSPRGLIEGLFTASWKPWKAGLAIGLVAVLAHLSSAASGRNYPMALDEGVSGIHCALVENDVEHVWRAPNGEDAGEPMHGLNWWPLLLVLGVIPGSWVAATMASEVNWIAKRAKPLFPTFLGGVILGVGACVGNGCEVAHLMSGCALLGLGSILFGLAFACAIWILEGLPLWLARGEESFGDSSEIEIAASPTLPASAAVSTAAEIERPASEPGQKPQRTQKTRKTEKIRKIAKTVKATRGQEKSRPRIRPSTALISLAALVCCCALVYLASSGLSRERVLDESDRFSQADSSERSGAGASRSPREFSVPIKKRQLYTSPIEFGDFGKSKSQPVRIPSEARGTEETEPQKVWIPGKVMDSEEPQPQPVRIPVEAREPVEAKPPVFQTPEIPKDSRPKTGIESAPTVPKAPPARVDVSSYRPGGWFDAVKAQTDKIKKALQINASFETSGANMKFDRIRNCVIEIERYPEDLRRVAGILEEAKSSKDPNAWIKWRKESAVSFSQTKQADLLEALIRSKRFDCEMEEELDSLSDAVEDMEDEAEDFKFSEDCMRDVLQALQALQRKYGEEFQNLDSAVTNFQYWE